MSAITIKRELPATRCEICHQADCFELETGICTRCQELIPALQPNPSGISDVSRENRDDDRFGFWDWGIFAPYVLVLLGILLLPAFGSFALFALFVSLMYALIGLCGIYDARRNRKPLRIPLLWTLLGGGPFWVLLGLLILIAMPMLFIGSLFEN